MSTKNHKAKDQWGNWFHNLGAHPRKALLERLGRTKAQRIYVDTASGQARHIGWYIGGHWLTVYEVTPLGGDK